MAVSEISGRSFSLRIFIAIELRFQTFWTGNTKYWRGKYHCTIDLLFDWFGISCMTTNNFCFYLQKRLIQTSKKFGQRHSDISPFSIPWSSLCCILIEVPLGWQSWGPTKKFDNTYHQSYFRYKPGEVYLLPRKMDEYVASLHLVAVS